MPILLTYLLSLALLITMPTDAQNFDAANAWLQSRTQVPTALSTRELSLAPDFQPQVRMHAFYSAKVTEANVLTALQQEVADFTSGKTDLVSARARLKTFLAAQGISADDVATTGTPPAGMSEEDWKARKQLTNLASTRRLNLILEQNAFMAHAIGNREISMDPDILARWPYYKYIAVGDARTRSTHAALNGMVLPKTDPFWTTHTPPWDFGCRCQLEDADESDATAAGGLAKAVSHDLPDGTQESTVVPASGQLQNIGPNPSGYTFRPADAFTVPDWSLVQDGAFKDQIQAEYDKLRQAAAMPTAPAPALDLAAIKSAVGQIGTPAELGLPAEKDIPAMGALPRRTDTAAAEVKLKAEFTTADPLGREVTFGETLLGHATGQDRDTRLRFLPTAEATVANPAEIWEHDHRHYYLGVYTVEGAKKRGFNVVGARVAEDHNKVISIHPKDMPALKTIRKGKLLYVGYA